MPRMFPLSIKDVDSDKAKELLSDFKGQREGFIHFGEKKWCLPARYAEHAKGFYEFPLRPDDVWIVTFPRSGTTLSQELVWLLKNNLDFKTSSEVYLSLRSPFFDFSMLQDPAVLKEILSLNGNDPDVEVYLKNRVIPGYKRWNDLPSPRVMKTHLPLSLLPPSLLDTCKVIYVARNPKDTLISYYHHNKSSSDFQFQNDFAKYWQYFKRNLVCYSPYWEHVNEAWAKRHNPNLHFMFYENLIKDMPSEIKALSNFCDVELSDGQIKMLVDHLKIDNFRENIAITRRADVEGCLKGGIRSYIRNGKINGGDPELTEELEKEIDAWIAEKLKETEIPYPKE